MSGAHPPDLFSSSTEVLQDVDELCDRFEQAWRGASRLSIESFLEAADARLRPLLLGELLVLEIQLRQNSGAVPVMNEYTRRFPDDRTLIRWVLLESVVPFPGPLQLDDFGRYRILDRLGSGGMGVVFKAEDARTGQLVALKVLAPALARDQQAVRRFEREIEVVRQLQHPNLATLINAGEFDGLLYFATEYVEGANLKELLRQHEMVGVAEAAELVRRVAEGLHTIHGRGVIHRDLKPSNILFSDNERVVVLDFGLARSVSPYVTDEQIREEGATLGTFDYMAPEQWDNPERADEKSDVYSLGCTLFHLLTGHPPFAGPAHEMVHQKRVGHREETPPSLEEIRPDVPEPLRRILERMLAKDPTVRFATASELAHALEPFARGADLRALLKRTSQGLTEEVTGRQIGPARP